MIAQSRRRPSLTVRAALLCALLVVVGATLAACSDTEEIAGTVDVVGEGYSADGTMYSVRIVDGRVGPPGTDKMIASVSYSWTDRNGRAITGTAVQTFPYSSPFLRYGGGRKSVSGTFPIPTHAGGGQLRVQVRSVTEATNCIFLGCDNRTFVQWSNTLQVPARVAAATAAPVAAVTAPTASLFAENDPPGAEGTTFDARLSSGSGTLSYAWADSCGSGDRFGAALPAGQRHVMSTTAVVACSVTVTDAATGLTATAAVETRAGLPAMHNGSFTFDGTGSVRVTGPRNGPVPSVACVNVDGAAPLARAVLLDQADGSHAQYGTTTVPLAASGLHRITASFWPIGANDTCTNTTLTGTGLIQVASALYTADGSGGARSLRSGYSAKSALRLRTATTVRNGTLSKTGVRSGTITKGRYSWSMPASGGGTPRPAGLDDLAAGTYASRVTELVFGPGTGNRVALLGTTLVLLRGASGTLACARIDGSPDATTVALLGGSGSAARQTARLDATATRYQLPTTAAGWRNARVRPTTIRGTLSAATATRAAKLPRACAALKRYLP